MANRSFLLTTYKLYHHLDKVKGSAKANCLSVYMCIMKYAWKRNNYECGLRHSTIAKDTGLSRSTIHRTLLTLAKLNILKMIKGRSGKTYRVNATFLVPEKTGAYKSDTLMYKSDTKNVSNIQTLEEQYNNIQYTEIDKIISKGLDTENIIEQLSKLPLANLKDNLKSNPYYINKAIALKEYNDKPKVELNTGAVLKDLKKKTNAHYRYKVEYNKRNNLDWKGRPKN